MSTYIPVGLESPRAAASAKYLFRSFVSDICAVHIIGVDADIMSARASLWGRHLLPLPAHSWLLDFGAFVHTLFLPS